MVDITKALAHSCNYFFYEIGHEMATTKEDTYSDSLGISVLTKYAELFGFDAKSGVEIAEAEPRISTRDAVRSAIGYYHSFTPVQISRYITTVANQGTCYNLTLIDQVIDKDGNLVPEKFLTTDILAYYSVDPTVGLYEYGYLAPNADLHEYDFLKEYYTNKYGEPAKETWEWNDPQYKPTGKEDYYQMFTDGLVKVVTVWDIKELDTVLVMDWLNDPQKYNNNFGQISFYDRSEDFSVDAVDEAEASAQQ